MRVIWTSLLIVVRGLWRLGWWWTSPSGGPSVWQGVRDGRSAERARLATFAAIEQERAQAAMHAELRAAEDSDDRRAWP